MTRTRTADAVLSACARTVSGRPSTAVGRIASGTAPCIGWASRQPAVRSCRPVPARRPRQRAAIPCPPRLPGVVALYPLCCYPFGGLPRPTQDGHLIPEGTFYVY